MSLVDACGWSALRGVLIALAAVPLCLWLVRFLRASPRAGWWLLLIPFLTPDLLVGYAYGNFSNLPLVHYPWLCELLYGGLLWMKLVPAGALVMSLTPPAPLTPEAIFCRRLAGVRTSNWTAAGDFIRGPLRQTFPAVGLMFLLAFQDFELGALLGISAGRAGSPVSWTRVLFDDQQGVVDRLAPLRWALWPLLYDLALLLPLIWLVSRSRRLTAGKEQPPRPLTPAVRVVIWGYLAVAAVTVLIVPLVSVARESSGGFEALIRSSDQFIGLLREIAVGMAFASVAGLSAYLLAAVPLRIGAPAGSFAPHAARRPVLLLLVPGLAGSLIVGLSVLYLFQTDWLYRAYDTPLPLVMALVLFLAPRALLLQLLLRAAQPREPAFLARLLANSRTARQRQRAGALLWTLERRRHFWAAALLAFWAYWDLTSAAMLHPSSMVPASVRLYNLMHYGHNAVLSAMTLTAIALPLLLMWAVASLLRPLSGRFV